MDIIDKLYNYYDKDTRKGLCNIITSYIIIPNIEEEYRKFSKIKKIYFMSFGKITHSKKYKLCWRKYNEYIENMTQDELDDLIDSIA